ncbi:hypothetical protein BGZ76_008919 [Entomortierella beljakovae]|nr:hypothetical protein BGZ76_008919 [Entomortierella beljakovae]
MAMTQIAFLTDLLESIPHASETPSKQGIQAIKRWTGLLLDIIIHPTQWRKLGFAVQWAKWIEWEGGHDLKSPLRSPGVLYLQNPLHPFVLNNLLNQVDLSLIDIETLVGCVDTGDWTCLLKEGEQADPKLREQVCESLEHLCLLSFYLRRGLASIPRQQGSDIPIDPKELNDDKLVTDLVERILKDDSTNSSSAKSALWSQAFSEQTLRLTSQQDPTNPLLPSKLSVVLNEVLEVIRLNKIQRDGWNDPSVSDKLSDAEFQKLGKLLSTSFFTFIEYADTSLFLSVENIIFLSKFAAQLPVSWYSDNFLKTTIQVARRYLFTERVEKIRIPFQIKGLAAISSLWSFWMRKAGSGDVNILGQELVEIMAEILSTTSLFTGSETKGIFGACFAGLATGLDKWSGLMEPKITQGLVSGLEHGRVSARDTDLDGIQASLATVLRSDVLNENPESIKKVIRAFLEVFYGTTVVLEIPSSASTIDELLQIQRLFQFVLTYKAGLTPIKESEETKKKRKKRKSKKVVNLKGLVWFEAMIDGVQDISARGALTSLLAVAGVLRAIQHGPDDQPRVDAESLALVQDLFVAKLNDITDTLKGEGDLPIISHRTQGCIVFVSSQTIPNLPACKLEAIDCTLLANLLVDYILQSNKGVVPVSDILRVISYEAAREGDRLLLDGTSHKLLSKVVKEPIFAEMGRVARAVANLIENIKDWNEIESFYAYLYFVTYKLGPGSFQVYEELLTSILARMVTNEDISPAQQVLDSNENTNRHILLNKTIKEMMPRSELGFQDAVMESRTLFFMNLLERLMVAIEEGLLEQQLLPLVYPYLLRNDQRELFESSHSVVMAVFLTNKKIARQVAPFYSNLLLQHFPDQINIDQLRAAFTTMTRSLSETDDALAWLCVESLLEKIRLYDELTETEDESSSKGSTRSLKKEQFDRENEKALIQVAHESTSPSISALPSPSATTLASSARSLAVLERQKQRGEILLAIFDQLTSLNLIFVETLGEKIRGLLAKEDSLVARKALLKCILDVIGGPHVDQTKRDWAVKWYLGLVNEFGHNLSTASSSNTSPSASA